MNARFRTSLSALAAAAACAFATSASAQSTWNVYNASNSGGGCAQATGTGSNAGSFNNAWNCNAVAGGTAGTSMTASAWSADSDRGATALISGQNTAVGQTYALSGSGFASAFLSDQGISGLGGTSRLEAQRAQAGGDTSPLDPTQPNHSFDSVAPGSFDMMLLSFGSAVIVDKIGIGWKGTDSDLVLMRWTGAAAPTRSTGTSTLTGDGEQNLAATLFSTATPSTAGWQLVGAYADLGTDNTVAVGGAARNTGAANDMASSWWLISAFNTTLAGSATSNNCRNAAGALATCSVGDDAFKLNYVVTRTAATPPSRVSEPGSLALAGLALVGLVGLGRRKTAAAPSA